MTSELQAIKAHVEEMVLAIELKDREIQDLKTQNTTNTARIQELERSLADITTEQERKTQELATIQAENDDLVSRIIEATKIINESMNLLDQLRSSKRTEDTRELLQKFQTTTSMIQAISNSLQGLQNSSGGGKIYKKNKKTRKTRKTKKYRGGFTYGTSYSFRKKNKKSASSSSYLFNKHKKKK